ncbi:endonuclease/exonuclease/phosphatase family protein [Gracilibacillus sp. YIM 98692]|uniref:endonuclease/exonuclease/phosphatase family protein n=1 Tax=Gracilibacillus sp. YIM 98692 TaxID=2663532 RepID=UPI0013D802C1|nr:endonuclease/exonuclease/phosphatase family protein [Gracilibacillus sp. YIM 98692]
MYIKIMTYNIHHGEGIDKKLDLNRISDVITKSNADIIGLNEVDKHFSKRSDYVDQMDFLANKLNYYYAFGPSLSLKSKKERFIPEYGNGILSRFPLQTSHNHLFDKGPCFIEGRAILEATIELNQKLVNVYVTHLSLSPNLHKKQSDFIIRKAKKPAIILGDWNMKGLSKRWKKIVEEYEDVWETAGNTSGFTYPSKKPRKRLDYIFVSEDIKIIDVQVIDSFPLASDHLPLMATLAI